MQPPPPPPSAVLKASDFTKNPKSIGGATECGETEREVEGHNHVWIIFVSLLALSLF